MADFINGQALKVAIESVRQTQKADAARVRYALGEVARNVDIRKMSRGKNKGKFRVKRGASVVRQDSLAERILFARKAMTGDFGVKGNTMEEKIQRFIASRSRSAGFIASGWIPARNILFGWVKEKPGKARSLQGARQVGRAKGTATPATFRLKSVLTATIVNKALNAIVRPPSGRGDPDKVGIQGLQLAMNEAARDMAKELERRLEKDIKKVSAK